MSWELFRSVHDIAGLYFRKMPLVAVRIIKYALYDNPGEGRRGSEETEGRDKGLGQIWRIFKRQHEQLITENNLLLLVIRFCLYYFLNFKKLCFRERVNLIFKNGFTMNK